MTHKRRIMMTAAALITLIALLVGAGSAAAQQPFWHSPRISIVWPHNGAGVFTSVANSKAVNISVWPSDAVSCETPPERELVLWRAHNNEPAVPLDMDGEFFMREAEGVAFPSMEFNTVPADMTSTPYGRYYFLLGFEGNVWVDAADARTYLPHPAEPIGFSESDEPGSVDTRIQIVWPHDADGDFAPVEQATYANVAVDVFEHGTLKSVPTDYDARLILYMAEANYPMRATRANNPSQYIAYAEKTTYEVDGLEYPRWVFNDVQVEPGHQYHYLVRVEGVTTYPTIWTHAADARTYLPHPTPPPACE